LITLDVEKLQVLFTCISVFDEMQERDQQKNTCMKLVAKLEKQLAEAKQRP